MGSEALPLESKRLTLREIQYGDLTQMDAWSPFSDPLHRLWNIPRQNSLSREVWFMLHRSDPTRLWFVVERRADRSVIGSITLREVVVHRSARLGISFGAPYVDQGYGSEALQLFLPYYFEELDFERLLLDVAGANERARHVYEKLGFSYFGRHYRSVPAEVSLSFLDEEQHRSLRVYFRRHMGRMQLLFYDMVLERCRWREGQVDLNAT